MSVGSGPSGATGLAKLLAEVQAEGADVSAEREDLMRRAVAALRASRAADQEVAEAFDALLRFEYGELAEDPPHGPAGDAAVVVESVAMLDRGREDLLRLLEAWVGRPVLQGITAASGPVTG